MANMQFANNAVTTLVSGITSIATSMTVTSATAFPSLTGAQYFYCTLIDAATGLVIEIVKVTAVVASVFTIVRAQDGTTASAYLTGDKVELRLVRAELQDFPLLDEANTFSGPSSTFTNPPIFTSPLTVANGGTGAGTYANAYALFGNTTSAFVTSSLYFSSANQLNWGQSGTAAASTLFVLQGSNNAAGGSSILGNRNGSGSYLIGDTATALGSGTGLINYVYGANPTIWYNNATEKMRLFSSGGLSLGNTTDPGATNLSVTGTGRFAGIMATAGTTTVPPIQLTSGTNLTSATAGAIEYDGVNFYATTDTTNGRNVVPEYQQFYLSSNVTAFGPASGDFFGATSSASLAATTSYDIECYCYFLKTTAGTGQWIPTFSTALTVGHSYLEYTPVTGFTTTVITGAMVTAEATQQTTTVLTNAATASLTTAVSHIAKLRIRVLTNTACNFRLKFVGSAGTITPQAGSWYTVRKVASNAGNFVA